LTQRESLGTVCDRLTCHDPRCFQLPGTEHSTFGGNPVTSVAAKATIDFIEEENLLDATLSVHFSGKTRRAASEDALIGEVRGMG